MANEDELLRMTLTVVDRATGELAKIEKSLKGVGECATHRFRQPAAKNVTPRRGQNGFLAARERVR
jgi:hypothetical protein